MDWRLKRLIQSADTRITPLSINDVEPAYLLSGDYQYYFALSRLQNALDTIKKDGRYKRVLKRYME